MTPEDRESLLSLRRQQAELQRALDRLNCQLGDLEARIASTSTEAFVPPPLPPHHDLPPLPMYDEPEPELQPTPFSDLHELPPIPTTPEHALHDLPPLPLHPEPRPSIEFQLGRWLTAIGAVFGVIALALFLGQNHAYVYHLLGPSGILALSATASVGVILWGERLDRRGGALRFVGRALTAMALVWLYLTAYAACHDEDLRVIHSPLAAGILLLSWSGYVFLLAGRKKSQVLSLFAIALAYFSTALNPVDSFTMAADLLLAVTAVLFMWRNGWTTLSYFSLVGTYVAFLRRLIMDESGDVVLDTSRTLYFWPHAVYLIGAWVIFTAAVLLVNAPSFRGGVRLAFLSLNNGALAGLLLYTANIAGYGYEPMGWILFTTGIVLLVMSRVAGWTPVDAGEVMAAYAAQGLALVTGGIMVIFTGITRGLLLMLETLFLGAAAAFARDRILIVTTHVAGFFATLFLVWEIAVNAHHPWILGAGGAAVLLLNAWWSRSEIRESPKTRSTVVLSSAFFCTLALGLIYAVLGSELSEDALPPALALVALGLTFSIYLVRLYELPPLAQTFLLAAQALVLFPAETGEELPWWTTAWVAAITLLMVTWWSRQRTTRTGWWSLALNCVYALALVGLTYQALRPCVDQQGWMVAASLLSLGYLIYGAFTRTWTIAAMGQLFLAAAVVHFIFPDEDVFPWTWWAAAMPVAVVFSTARAAHEWLRLFTEIPPPIRRKPLSLLAYGYELLALGMVARWIFALVPEPDQMSLFLFLGTLLLSWNVRVPSTFGVRCSFVLSVLGMLVYLQDFGNSAQATFFNTVAMLAFLTQPALLRRGTKALVTPLESWTLILLSVGTGWLFVSAWVETRFHSNYLTMGWTLYALFLFLFGLLVRERRQRWAGLAILLMAIVRVFVCDFWGFSNGYRVLTFVVLMLVTLGLGFIYARFADRLKAWL